MTEESIENKQRSLLSFFIKGTIPIGIFEGRLNNLINESEERHTKLAGECNKLKEKEAFSLKEFMEALQFLTTDNEVLRGKIESEINEKDKLRLQLEKQRANNKNMEYELEKTHDLEEGYIKRGHEVEQIKEEYGRIELTNIGLRALLGTVVGICTRAGERKIPLDSLALAEHIRKTIIDDPNFSKYTHTT